MRKIRKPRDVTCIWTRPYEDLLFQLWEENIPKFKSSQRNCDIYAEMAVIFADAGFDVEWKKVRSKMDNLLKRYRHELAAMRGINGRPSTWEYFKRMHKIVGPQGSENILEEMIELAQKPTTIKPDDEEFGSIISSADSFIMDSSEDSLPTDSKGQLPENDTDEPHAKKAKKTSSISEMTSFELAMIEVVRERSEDLRKAAVERLNVMNRFLESTMEFQKKTLEIISKEKQQKDSKTTHCSME